MNAPSPVETPKPVWRGRLHQAAFFVAVPAGIVLVAVAHTTATRVGAAVFALSLAGLYGVSAAYHRGRWSPRSVRTMKRLDHSMIFVLIAGSWTPLALLLSKPWSIIALAVVWGGSLLGIGLKLLKVDGLPILSGALYVTLGWLVVLVLPQLARRMTGLDLGLLLAGGLLYTGGVVVLARNRPSPRPLVFGYHEVWHSMVVGAGVCHYTMVLLITMSAR